MKTIKISVPQISRIQQLLTFVKGTRGDFLLANKIEDRVLLKPDEMKAAKIVQDKTNQRLLSFNEKYRHEVELSDDMFELMKKTYMNFFEPLGDVENPENKSYKEVREMMILEELFEEPTEDEKAKPKAKK